MLDTSGNQIIRHTFGGPAADALFNLVELPNMEFMCTGYSRSYNGYSAYDVVLFKIDSTGKIKWLKNIYSPGIDIGYKIIPSVNGDYLITGLFADNNGNYFLMRSDTIPNTSVGINSFEKQSEWNIYPNPCNELFYIDCPNENTSEINADIADLMGQKIKSISLQKGRNSIQTNNLSPGVYTITLKSPAGLITVKKLVING